MTPKSGTVVIPKEQEEYIDVSEVGTLKPTGKGWMTMDEFGRRTKTGRCKRYRVMKQLTDSKEWEAFVGKEFCPIQRCLVRRVWYRKAVK